MFRNVKKYFTVEKIAASKAMQFIPYYAMVYIVQASILGRLDYNHFDLSQLLLLIYHISGAVALLISIIVLCANVIALHRICRDRL